MPQSSIQPKIRFIIDTLRIDLYKRINCHGELQTKDIWIGNSDFFRYSPQANDLNQSPGNFSGNHKRPNLLSDRNVVLYACNQVPSAICFVLLSQPYYWDQWDAENYGPSTLLKHSCYGNGDCGNGKHTEASANAPRLLLQKGSVHCAPFNRNRESLAFDKGSTTGFLSQ